MRPWFPFLGVSLLLVMPIAATGCGDDEQPEPDETAWVEDLQIGGISGYSVEVGDQLTCSGVIGSEPESLATLVTLRWSRWMATTGEDILVGEPTAGKTAELALTLTDENTELTGATGPHVGTAEEVCCSMGAETEAGDFLFGGYTVCVRLIS